MDADKAIQRENLFIFGNRLRNDNWSAFIVYIKAGVAIVGTTANDAFYEHIPDFVLICQCNSLLCIKPLLEVWSV